MTPSGAHPFGPTVTFPGATMVNGMAEALTGQQVTALMTLNPLPTNPGDRIIYAWAVKGNTGINPYKDYDTNAPDSTNATQLVPLKDADYAQSGVNFYDETNGETLTWSCTATFPDTPGAAPQSNSGSVTFLKPTATAWGITGGVVRSPLGDVGLFGNPEDTTYTHGMDWHDVTITVPSPFHGGSFCFAQLVTPDRKFYRTVAPGSSASSYYQIKNNGQLGLDTSVPFRNTLSIPSVPTTSLDYDSPQVGNPGADQPITVTDDGGSAWN